MRKKNDKLNIYCAEGDPDYGCVYIAALTSKEARNIAQGTFVAETVCNPYINVRVTLCKYNHSDLIKRPGELCITEINDAGLSWWCCPKCDDDDFTIIDGWHYKCNKCGHEDEIPYVN